MLKDLETIETECILLLHKGRAWILHIISSFVISRYCHTRGVPNPQFLLPLILYLQLCSFYVEGEEVDLRGVDGEEERIQREALDPGEDPPPVGLLALARYVAHGVALPAGNTETDYI